VSDHGFGPHAEAAGLQIVRRSPHVREIDFR
jgi:hypothetical protein